MIAPAVTRIVFAALLAACAGARPRNRAGCTQRQDRVRSRRRRWKASLVSAKKAGSTITVTVVSDAKGAYAFPADRLAPGSYHADDQGGRLCARRRGHGRACGRQDRGRRPQAQARAGAIRATDQRRMAGERARSRRDEAQPAQLRGLPFAAPDFRTRSTAAPIS